jgi:putative tricarboxylic transport membrane protein
MGHASEVASSLALGFSTALAPTNLLFGLLGVVLGTAVGVLPGLGPAATISLLLPITFGLDPTTAFILFGGIYYGAMYGGSTTSILVNTPGDAAAAVTTLDGYRMAQNGRAGAALTTAAVGSFVAGTIATALLTLAAPALVGVALRFGPPEYFALMVFAMTTVGSLAGDAPAKAGFATCLGLLLGLIGIDLQTGQSRLTFGRPELIGGIDVVLGAIGLFAIGEVLWAAAHPPSSEEEKVAPVGSLYMTREEWRRSIPAWLRGTGVGFATGMLPGAGGTVATFLAYNVERNASKHPEEFGHGAIEGVAGPEAANNASAGGAMVPLLGLGIPGGGTTAVMLAAFQLYGLTPGPLLFQQKPDLVWGLIASLYIGNVLLLLLNLPLVGIWVKLLQVPRPLLFGGVAVFGMLGAFSSSGAVSDLVIVTLLGLLAYALRASGFPLAPVLLGLVLGPLVEQELRRSLALSGGNPMILVTRPLALAFLTLAVVSAGGPAFARYRRARRVGKLPA